MTPLRSWKTTLAWVAAGALLLGACGSEPDLLRDARPAQSPLPVAEAAGLRLPSSFEDLELAEPGWSAPAQYADGVFLAPVERDEVLEFTAVDVHGQALWSAQRPLSCTGFVVTTDSQGRALAILGDTQTTDENLAELSATAYDMTTGEQVWGPVPLPGTFQGPGLVFAAKPSDFMGATGPRVALDATTGQPATADSEPGVDKVVGEYDGTVLTTAGDFLIASRSFDGAELWRVSISEHGWSADSLAGVLDVDPGNSWTLLVTSQTSRALINLGDGTVLSESAQDAAVDPSTGTLTFIDAEGLHAYDQTLSPLWSVGISPGTQIEAAGNVLVYLREGNAVRVHNVLTGAVAQGYPSGGEGVVVVPEIITPEGGTVLLDGDRRLVAALPKAPDTAPEDPQGP